MLKKSIGDFLHKALYRGRVVGAAASLLFVLYCAGYLWFYVPHGGPIYAWRPDSQLIVRRLPTEMAVTGLQLGDRVTSIDGQRPQRMRPVYPLPVRREYEVTVLRGEETFTEKILVYAPLSTRIVAILLPATLIALLGWLVGALILFFARPRQREAVHVGYIFLLASMVLIGLQASLEGVPGAWFAGHVLIYFLAWGWVYLGLVPRDVPLGGRARKILAGLAVLSLTLAAIAYYEVVLLFPQGSSLQEEIGVSFYSLSFMLSAVSLISCVALLAWRVLRLPAASYLRRQLLILLFFFGVGILPTMFLTIVPRALLDRAFLPFPAAIILMAFVPAGYLFVIYRRGFLELDIFFSRALYFMVLALCAFAFYASGLYLVQHWLQLDGIEAVVPATIIFFPTLLLIVYMNQRVYHFVQRLIYGQPLTVEEYLAELSVALSTQPELGTLQTVVESLAELFTAAQAVLVLRDRHGRFLPIAQVGCEWTQEVSPLYIQDITEPIIRTMVEDSLLVADKQRSLFQLWSWAEMLLPITERGEPIGLLALSRPGGDGYFDAQQVLFLMRASSALGIACQNLYLFESTRRLSRDLLAAQKQERKSLASKIHDDPLQRITYVTTLLDQIVSNRPPLSPEQIQEQMANGTRHLRLTADALRGICAGLHSPLWDQGLAMAVTEIVDAFEFEHDLQIEVEMEIGDEDAIFNEKIPTVCHILTEALNNVVKHAQARIAFVSLRGDTKGLELEVADEGMGSGLPDMSVSDLIRQQHLGIVGMYEWARLAGAKLTFQANQPGGMRVRLECPLG